ncbi:hypothetical protein NRIC_16260 [Enterococcus florum]|uniref:PIN like domain-containing protein n=1 Tax=Enterococcus florum TaxID=2480627 RepID=A0A4P5P707_9ENTE|nr:PIN-like domain-containing protein [Enterococcus florum]GCF93735.1 hypothetical protein NRIC_16260 [Enterococcus florum]
MANIDNYFVTQKKIDELICLDDTCVVLDTNVLLATYQWRQATKKQIENIIEKFSADGKLKFSLQVIKEFSKNRSILIQERIDDVSEEINKINISTSIDKLVPVLNGTQRFEETQNLQEAYMKATNIYTGQLRKIKKDLNKLLYYDEFFELIHQTSKLNLIQDYNDEYLEDVYREGRERFDKNVPPGFKDGKKKNGNEYGDFILWKDLISLKSNVVFVSNDEKEDWCLKDSNGQTLSTRPELLKEFFKETGGKNFIHISLLNLVKFLDNDVPEDVLADLQESPFEDTIIVPARKEGFDRVFLGEKQWYDIRINNNRIGNIKYIAAYQVAPIKAIVYYAKVKEIVESDNIPGYKKVIFDGEPIKLEEPIKLGDNVALAPQNSRYVHFNQLTSARSLDELFE